MKLVPLAFESLGVRSMCTFIQTDQGILIDPGTSIAPQRFKLAPSIEEFITLKQTRHVLLKYAEKSSIVTVSHYHHDHFTPFEENKFLDSSPEYARMIYEGKKIFLKDPENNINKNQHSRAQKLLKNLQNVENCEINFSEGEKFQIGDTQLKFSPALSHGNDNSPLGYIVALSISYNGQKITHASDVQGPISDLAQEYILKENPDILILSGPPLYLLGYVLSKDALNKSRENLKELCNQIPQVIVDHHLLRTTRGLNFIKNLNKNAKGKVMAASDICSKKPLLLEANRKKLNR